MIFHQIDAGGDRNFVHLIADKKGTGYEASLTDFVGAIFSAAGLDWHHHVDTDPSLFRPSELLRSVGDPTRARTELGWQPRMLWRDFAQALVEAERQATAKPRL